MLSNASCNAKNITTVATTVVKSRAGNLVAVNINSKGTVASTVKVYDGVDATGTLLATVDSLNYLGPIPFNVACGVGICVVTTGTVAPDVTVVYI